MADVDLLVPGDEEDQDGLLSTRDTTGSSERKDEKHGECYMPHRYVLFVLCFTCTLLVCSVRASFNLALVAMVNMTTQLNTSDECPVMQPLNTSDSTTNNGEFNWSSETQGVLLSSFYYGYIILQMPGGYVAERFGAKRLILVCVFIPAAINLAIPQLARWNVDYVIAARAFSGFVSGALYPGLYALWARWAPSAERTFLVGGSCAGLIFGELIAFGLTGYLCDSASLGGWPSVFYLFGGLNVLWCIFWAVFAHDSPATDPSISTKEKNYIETGTGSLDHAKFKTPPYLAILTSRPVLAGNVVCFTDGFGFYILFSSLPIYMRQILRFNITENGIVSMMPVISAAVGQLIFPPLVDYIRALRVLSNTAVRKIATGVGTLGMSAMFLLVPQAGCDRISAIAILMVSTFLEAAVLAGYAVNAQDLAPQYAGTLCGLGNMIANLCGFIAPLMVEALTEESPSLSGWSHVFYSTAGVMTFGGLFYILFASGEMQDWAEAEISYLHVAPEDYRDTEDSTEVPSPLSEADTQPTIDRKYASIQSVT